ncbi:hypothetical protein GHNINEIG_00207 [Hydrogenovibrio crunogenus]|uniref:Uncharacterized protein n=1 Tax=Hydrogenovibrio crunogenus TaxID=39765 RepID=A0A4P7NWU9_9GAMM|nr:hypothetical protein GHNINEIG_00207 [Hydrogenovibrio crunogenus]
MSDKIRRKDGGRNPVDRVINGVDRTKPTDRIKPNSPPPAPKPKK